MTNPYGFTQDVLLTNYARLLGPQLGDFIAEDVFPAIDVSTKTGNFHDVGGGFYAASPGSKMVIADGQPAPNVIDVTISKVAGWNVDESGLGVQVKTSSEEYARGNGLDLEQAKTAVLARATKIIRERIAAGLAFATGSFTSQTAALAGGDRWDTSTSNPSQDSQDAKDNVIQATGEEPRSLAVGYEVHKALRTHAQILEYASRTARRVGVTTDEDIRGALDVDDYFVGRAVANSAVEGQTASRAYIWGKFAMFGTLRSTPTPMTPGSLCQRFRLRGSMDGAINKWDVSPYMRQIDMVWNDQFVLVTASSGQRQGYLYSTVVS